MHNNSMFYILNIYTVYISDVLVYSIPFLYNINLDGGQAKPRVVFRNKAGQGTLKVTEDNDCIPFIDLDYLVCLINKFTYFHLYKKSWDRYILQIIFSSVANLQPQTAGKECR